MTSIPTFSPFDSLSRADLPNAFSAMKTEDFVRIMFTELTNQDPLAPNDTAALLEQISSIRSVESDIKLVDQLKSLVQENQLSAASGLIGKFIGGLTDDLIRVAGVVVSVVRMGESVYLELDNGWFVPMDGVETVVGIEPAGDADEPASP